MIPQSLINLSELPGAEFLQQLDGAAGDLPLIDRVVGQTISLWTLSLANTHTHTHTVLLYYRGQ